VFNRLLDEVQRLGLIGRVDISMGFRTMRELQAALERKAIGVLHYDRTDGASLSTSLSADMAAGTSSQGTSLVQPAGTSLGSAPPVTGEGASSLMGLRCQSAAVFRVWSAGLPCIVSQSQHFELGPDLRPALIRARHEEELIQQIRHLCQPATYSDAVARIRQCAQRQWSDVARDYEHVFESARQRATAV
jgi:hypothetical protein